MTTPNKDRAAHALIPPKCSSCSFQGNDKYCVDMGGYLICQDCVFQANKSLVEWSLDRVSDEQKENATLRAQIAKLTAPPSEEEILLCAAFSHNTLNSKGSFLNCTKEYRDKMLTIAKAAITKLLEMKK